MIDWGGSRKADGLKPQTGHAIINGEPVCHQPMSPFQNEWHLIATVPAAQRPPVGLGFFFNKLCKRCDRYVANNIT